MKKVLALILALVMVLSCFAGCGSKPATDAPAAEAPKTETPAETPAEPEKEIININVLMRGSNGNAAEAEVIAAMNAYSAEKIGVTISFTALSVAEFLESLPRMIAAKDPLDLTFVASYTGFNDLATNGGLLDLTDMINQPEFADLKAVMPENIWEASAVGGRNFCVPNYKETPYLRTLTTPVALADTIKDKYGIDFQALDAEVNSFRDLAKLEEYLLACQKEGVKYPALTQEVGMSLASLLKSDTEYELIGTNSYTPYVFNKETGKVSNIFNNPDFASYFETMVRWNELGLWNEDNVSLEWDPRDQVRAAAYGIYPNDGVPNDAAQQSATWGHPVYSIEATPATILSTGALGSAWAIPAYSDKADAALRWVQLVQTDKAFADLFIYGVEGVHYTRDSEDVVTKIPDSGWSHSTWKTCCFETPSIQSSQSPDLKQQYRDFNAAGVLGILAGFTPVYDKIETEWAAITAIYMEEYHLYTMGLLGNEDLADSMAKYEAAGDAKVIAELQAQVDAYLGK